MFTNNKKRIREREREIVNRRVLINNHFVSIIMNNKQFAFSTFNQLSYNVKKYLVAILFILSYIIQDNVNVLITRKEYI